MDFHDIDLVRNFKSLRPDKCAVRNNYSDITEPSWMQRYPLVSIDVIQFGHFSDQVVSVCLDT